MEDREWKIQKKKINIMIAALISSFLIGGGIVYLLIKIIRILAKG